MPTSKSTKKARGGAVECQTTEGWNTVMAEASKTFKGAIGDWPKHMAAAFATKCRAWRKGLKGAAFVRRRALPPA